MKKVLILAVALSLIIVGASVASVVSSKHDFRDASLFGSGVGAKAVGATTSQVCVFCHHPHRGAATGVSTVLLWNISAAAGSYATYSSPTTNATGIGSTLSSASDSSAMYSLLCMGCHDGAGSSNSFIRTTVDGVLGTVPVPAGNANLGTTLTDDHPVNFQYPTATAAGLEDINVTITNGKVDGTYPLFNDGAGNPTMQCATCHDVHNGGSARVQFMRGGTADVITNSKICRDCHTAK